MTANPHVGMTQYQIDEHRHQERMKALRAIVSLLGGILVVLLVFFLILMLALAGAL